MYIINTMAPLLQVTGNLPDGYLTEEYIASTQVCAHSWLNRKNTVKANIYVYLICHNAICYTALWLQSETLVLLKYNAEYLQRFKQFVYTQVINVHKQTSHKHKHVFSLPRLPKFLNIYRLLLIKLVNIQNTLYIATYRIQAK